MPGRYTATFVPLATITGSFDCGMYPTFPVTFYATGVTTSIEDAPEENATILGVMEFVPKGTEAPMDTGFFVSHICHFMPKDSALITIKGLDDPLVRETLKKVQDARLDHSGKE